MNISLKKEKKRTVQKVKDCENLGVQSNYAFLLSSLLCIKV
jgi:hypothetical protein